MDQQTIIFGCDLGGGIIDKVDNVSRAMFVAADYLNTPEVPGAFDALRSLVDATRGGDGKCNGYVISACEYSIRKRAEWWLKHRQFTQRTGIPWSNLLFCDSRKEKATLCKALGITHFIDDRVEVLSHLPAETEKFLFRPDQMEKTSFPTFVPQLRRTESWSDIIGQVLKSR